jgi:ACS family hexuronate transporter-like MFS transporter
MNVSLHESHVMASPELARQCRSTSNEAHVPRAGTGIRSMLGLWLPTLSIMLATLISYIDRNALAVLAPSILRDTGLSAQDYGFIVSTFSIAYVAGNLFWGRMLDRFGLFWVMVAAVALWSAVSAAHAFAFGFLGFAAARALLGFAEGATFPGALGTVVQTLPPSSRSRGIGVAYSGGSLGALATPLLVTPIALAWGWRAAFWATGGVGVVWLLVWLLQLRRAELSTPHQEDGDSGPDGLHCTDRRLWSFVCIYAMGALLVAFVLYAAPLFLSQRIGMSQAELGRVLWVPPLGMEAGFFVWGWAADRLIARRGCLPAFRGLFVALAVLSLPLAFAGRLDSARMVVAFLCFAMFNGGGFIVTALAYGTSVFPAAKSGLLAGLASGSWSALVAVTMPFFGRMFDQHRYNVAFATASAAPVVGLLTWWVLNSSSGRFVSWRRD